MPQTMSNAFKLELSKIEQNALIELYEVDMRSLQNRQGEQGEIYRFYAGTNERYQDIVWQGQTYKAYPIKAGGFELNGNGPSNRPTLTVSNLLGLITGIAVDFNEAVGAVVRRRQVYLHYLDAVNFREGNPQADPTQELVSLYIIEQLSSLKQDVATFTLALPTETDNAYLPARMMMADTCAWIYRSAECGYTGGSVADEKDMPTSDPKKDKCSRCLTGCKMRNNTLNFGGFPSINKVS